MRFTYVSAANNTTNGTELGALNQDIYVKKIIIGVPVASASIILFDATTAFSTQTTNIAFKYTLGADIAPADMTYQYERVIDFTGVGNPGLQLNGGNITVDQACQLTIIWEVVDQAE